MDYIRIKNLRSMRDTGEIEMKKINVLLGSNSSGKSTFLRVFPLLKQSFSKRINGPVLWCGDDDDYVDFGSFEEALNYNAHGEDDAIRLAFGFFADFAYFNNVLNQSVYKKEMRGKVKIEFAIRHNKDTMYDYVSELVLVHGNRDLKLCISKDNKVIKAVLDGMSVSIDRVSADFLDDAYGGEIFDISLFDVSQTAKKRIIKILGLGGNDTREIHVYLTCLDMVLKNKKVAQTIRDDEIYQKLVFEKKQNPDKIAELEKWVYLYELPRFFDFISRYLRKYFMGVSYIAPVRATAERYYKLRNLAVDEVDCRGKNLPVFLNSLPQDAFRDFQKWTLENLGFKVFASVSEGHVSLKIQKQGQAKAINLSDTGFGYSQILPIATQLWYIAAGIREDKNVRARRPLNDMPKTIVIEQPELHLHPALQAKLMDIIAKIAAEGRICFVIETHSETMVNRIGTLIDRKKISHEDVGIIIFNKKFGDDETQISKSSFDNEGYLENWPVGFFEPEEE